LLFYKLVVVVVVVLVVLLVGAAVGRNTLADINRARLSSDIFIRPSVARDNFAARCLLLGIQKHNSKAQSTALYTK
jgi:hypothetical protein